MRKIFVAVTGASGAPLALKLMQMLAVLPDIETACVVSASARKVAEKECGEDEGLFWALAKHAWAPEDMAAGPASGTWWQPGSAMVIAPCSMSCAGALASGYCANLIHRSGSVALKERRPLILVARESPLSQIHLRNLALLSEAGAIVMPFSPAFYFRPRSLDEMLEQFCWRVFDQLDISHAGPKWGEKKS